MKVLIVKTSSMGDVLHTFPALQDARRARPDIVFDWCVEEAFAPIVALHPAVGNIRTVAVRRWRKRPFDPSTWREASAMRKTLRSGGYDLVIDAQGLLKSALVAMQAGATVAGFDFKSAREPLAALFYRRRYSVARNLHAIERTRLLFAQALGYEPDLSLLVSGLSQTADTPAKTAFLLHGTSREDKKWPAEQWAQTARLLVAAGFTPLTTWSNDREKAVAEAIAAAVPETIVVEKSQLADIAKRIAGSTLVIGADTGLTHLASAYGLPTVAIFLTTEPGLTGPRGPNSSTLAAENGMAVEPAAVVAEAQRLLGQSRQ